MNIKSINNYILPIKFNKDAKKAHVLCDDTTYIVFSFLNISELIKTSKVSKNHLKLSKKNIEQRLKERCVEIVAMPDGKEKTFYLKYCLYHFSEKFISNINDNFIGDITFMRLWADLKGSEQDDKKAMGSDISKAVQLISNTNDLKPIKPNNLKDVLKLVSYIKVMQENGGNETVFKEYKTAISTLITGLTKREFYDAFKLLAKNRCYFKELKWLGTRTIFAKNRLFDELCDTCIKNNDLEQAKIYADQSGIFKHSNYLCLCVAYIKLKDFDKAEELAELAGDHKDEAYRLINKAKRKQLCEIL